MGARTKKEWIIRSVILMVALGYVILAYGMTMVIKSGAGTLICVALVEPVAGIFLPVNERIVAGIMKKFRY
ncbi:hypothetical protein [Butyrivibrio sp. XPD2002]|uniref:hypothetical protein n=1 Tax=Butyrivibrio sp. XPD2002 TaxID=1280665 RepID=UPI000404DE55|nr:hypothetical protein [Butyrivibrio sp. XPD2002]